MKDYFFTVVVPTYNSGNTVSKCLDSIFNQTYRNYEILILDNLSTDHTLSIVEDYISKYDCIKLVSEKDKGIYDAMNKGLELAQGKWIYFLGSDDVLNNELVFQNVHEAAKNTKSDVIYGNVLIVNDTSWTKDGSIYDGYFDFRKLLNRNICHQAIFYRSSFVIKEKLRYNISYKLLADWDFNLKCFSKTNFTYLDVVVANFVGGGETTRSNSDDNFYKNFLKNVLQYFKISIFNPVIVSARLPYYEELAKVEKKRHLIEYYYYELRKRIKI